MMEEALKAAGCDTKKMPLGKISAKMVKEGYGSLKKIEAELSKKKPDKKTLADLTSVFFTVVPHDIGFKKLSDFTIDDNTKLKEKLDLVDSLQQIEYANAITVDNGVDAMYKKLNMEIEPLPKSDADYKLVAKMVNNTHGKSHGHFTLELTNVFRLRKETQEKKFAAVGGKINNHMLLWHGSRLTNWCGILSQGLRIAPPEAPVTGYMPVKETIPDQGSRALSLSENGRVHLLFQAFQRAMFNMFTSKKSAAIKRERPPTSVM